MTDPFTAWSRMWSAGLDMQSTWLRGIETLQASALVIGVRTDMMRSVPGAGDLSEYARMVPEKVDAFSRSALAVAQGTINMHSAWADQMQRIGMMMLGGKIPTITEVATLTSQTAEYSVSALNAAARLGKGALAPFHRTATGNARRLGRAKRR